jgi:hypothetical protein
MNTEERLANLERELAQVKRRNRHLLLFAFVAAGVAVVAAAWIGTPGNVLAENGAKAPNVVRANEFILEDADGKGRATLSVLSDGPALRLANAKGKICAVLSVTKDTPKLGLIDENGKVRAALGATKDGAVLVLSDENDKARARLALDKDGPVLELSDEKGKDRAVLSALKDGPSLDLFDEKGKGRAALGSSKSRSPDGRIISCPESSLLLIGPDEKVIWQAP